MKITDLGNFTSPENLEEDIIETNCWKCDINFDSENERCQECENDLTHEN